MTSAEIIIRIKKARKKWKLIVPKKRVAAYRTNRWFAKPRWVEVELNYTQALRFGLVEQWVPPAETGAALPEGQSLPKPQYLRAPDAQPQNAAQLPRR